MKKVLVIRFSSLGDIILTSPVVETLALEHGYHTDFLTKEYYRPIARLIPGVSDVFAYGGDHRATISELRRGRYDVVIDLQKNPRSLLIAAALNPRIVCGYPKLKIRREIAIRGMRLKPEIPHVIDSYLKSLARLKIKPTVSRPGLVVPQPLIDEADEFLGNCDGKPLIGLAPGSKHPEKIWWGFADLIALIGATFEATIVVFAASADGLGFSLRQRFPALKYAIDLPLDLLAAVMARCRVVIANDSGLMHMAAALSVPVIGIFGPTHPILGFAPRGEKARIICDNVNCSPCSLHGEKKCRMPAKYCFENITADRVMNELMETLSETEGSVILRKTAR